MRYEGNISDFSEDIANPFPGLVVVEHRQVPAVDAKDPNAVEAIAELLAAIVDDELPVMAIEDEVVADPIDADRALRRHQELILAALALPGVNISHDNEFTNPRTIERTAETKLHFDSGSHPTFQGFLKMVLRQHGSLGQGAEAVFIASKRLREIGDAELYEMTYLAHFEAMQRQYDMQRMLSEHKACKQAPLGMTALAYLRPTIFHYHQSPGSSLIWPASSTLGGVPVHGFESENPKKPRQSHGYDLVIHGTGAISQYVIQN